MNPEVYSVVYPCGLVLEGGDAIISYGINDENLAITRIPMEELEGRMRSVASSELNFVATTIDPTPTPAGIFGPNKSGGVPLFWWDAKGKRFDSSGGERRFKIGNFGDIASRDIFERIGGIRAAQPVNGRRKVVSVGSVLHTARNGDVIWVPVSRAQLARYRIKSRRSISEQCADRLRSTSCASGALM